MNYIAFDLEMNQPSQKIIEIGVARIINGVYSYGSCLVDPKEPIDPYITRLTNISNEDIEEEGCTLFEAADWIWGQLTIEDLYSQPLTWGSGDLRELKKQMVAEGMEEEDIPWFNRTALNVQSIATFEVLKTNPKRAKNMSLKTACSHFKVDMTEPAHNADIDAFNTLKVFQAILAKNANHDKLLRGRGNDGS